MDKNQMTNKQKKTSKYRKSHPKKNSQNQKRNDNLEESGTIVYGKNSVKNEIETKTITKIYLQKTGNYSEVLPKIKAKNIPYVFVEKAFLDKMTQNQNHQGIVAISSEVKLLELEELIAKNKNVENPLIIMVDELQDPQNLGSVLRVVDAFAINGVIFNKRRSAQITSTVAKVSTGAINYVDLVRSNNLRQSIKKLKENGYFCAYLDMDGANEVNEVNYDMPLVVIIGGEDKGVTESMKKEADLGIKIKMSGHVNSLNVASAISILCYQKNISR